ncbi:MAG: peptide chain release factor 2 [Planctomycetes bacterium]|nr:peptide chain release factor 2 [Planctomycetota bacterium]
MNLDPAELFDQLQELIHKVRQLEEAVNVERGKARLAELEAEMSRPGFWDSPDKAQDVIAELKRLRGEIEPLEQLRRTLEDSLELARIAAGEHDESSLAEIQGETDKAAETLNQIELKTILSSQHDALSAFLSIQAGAGGTESCDWASMLARMFRRFCESQGFRVEMVDVVDGEEAGVKSVTYRVQGEYAYGYLRSEVGVHRLVRKSPFDAKNKRHTSFAAVDLVPDFPDVDKAIEINPADLRIDTYRAGGAGGQHVNVTDSAVRLTHLPTGIVVQCQNERSQHANRAMAMKFLKARLIREEHRKREEEMERIYGEKGEIAWGNQIRNYVLDPYTLVKDRRTGVETGNVTAVLDGEIFPFVDAYLRWKRSQGGGKQKASS